VPLVEKGASRVRSAGLLAQAAEALAGESVESIADGGGGAAELARDGRRRLTVGAGEDNLTAADGEGGRGAEATLQALPLAVGQRRNKKVWVHTSLFAPSCHQKRPRLPLH
jgi:hypothetical protein